MGDVQHAVERLFCEHVLEITRKWNDPDDQRKSEIRLYCEACGFFTGVRVKLEIIKMNINMGGCAVIKRTYFPHHPTGRTPYWTYYELCQFTNLGILNLKALKSTGKVTCTDCITILKQKGLYVD